MHPNINPTLVKEGGYWQFKQLDAIAAWRYLVKMPWYIPPKFMRDDPDKYLDSDKSLDEDIRMVNETLKIVVDGFDGEIPAHIENFANVLQAEASPLYQARPNSPKILSKVLPHTKYVVILRNPVKRFFSGYV